MEGINKIIYIKLQIYELNLIKFGYKYRMIQKMIAS